MAELTPWRKVARPQTDVAKGRYASAEFAADLSSVIAGTAAKEYGNSKEFFRRTHITKGIIKLVDMAMLRITGHGGQPILQLKTVFGGGKTHTMLALYHLLKGLNKVDADILAAFDPSWQSNPPKKAKMAVLVGTALDPTKPTPIDGHPNLKARTLWGHLAGQLGGAKGYAMIEDADAKGVSPGSNTLTKLFDEFGPCCIFIDEAVAYVRGLYGRGTLTAGNWDGNIDFFQHLTEALNKSSNAVGILSIPESDIEIGGEDGQKTTDAIEYRVKRQDDIGIPLDTDEGFEIVKRRLFNPDIDEDAREVTVEAFCKLYLDEAQIFPKKSSDLDYSERLRSCYPIHPEVFDQLYETWSQLEKFQRTRGVLKLMAKVIAKLWQDNDNSPLIMPGTLPLFDKTISTEFVRHLDNETVWLPIIDTEIDGDKSVPHRIDGTIPIYAQTQMARRVARTLFLGTAPRIRSQASGLDILHIRLGTLEPGVAVSRPSDVLEHIKQRSANLYDDGNRYWYDTQKNLNREAEEKASQIESFRVRDHIMSAIQKNTAKGRGEFEKVHCSDQPTEITDEMSQRLVIMPPETKWTDKGDEVWKETIMKILESKGGGKRLYRNSLSFVICDSTRWSDLEKSVRLLLAWTEISDHPETYNLDAFKRKEAKKMVKNSEMMVISRLAEAYRALVVPVQDDPKGEIEFITRNLPSDTIQSIASKASQQMVNDANLIPKYSPKLLSEDLQKWFLQDVEHIDLKRAIEAYFQFTYFPRLKNQKTFENAIYEGVSGRDFGHARSSKDGVYDNPRIGEDFGSFQMDGHAVLIRKDVAEKVVKEVEDAALKAADDIIPDGGTEHSQDNEQGSGASGSSKGTEDSAAKEDNLEAGSGSLVTQIIVDANIKSDSSRKEFDELTEHIVKHLIVDPKSKTKIRVTIESENSEGFDKATIRTVKENVTHISSIEQDPEFH